MLECVAQRSGGIELMAVVTGKEVPGEVGDLCSWGIQKAPSEEWEGPRRHGKRESVRVSFCPHPG